MIATLHPVFDEGETIAPDAGAIPHRTLCAKCGKIGVFLPFDLCPTCAEKDHHARRAESVDETQRRLFV